MQFEERLNKKVKDVNNIINAYLPKEPTLARSVIEAVDYSVSAGGKRIRPLIMQETFKMCGGTGSTVEPFMAALEFIHTYSLVHDDLPAMDNDMYRRGVPTTHARFGEALGILAGDALLNHAYETMLNAAVSYSLPSVSKNAILYGLCGGQDTITPSDGAEHAAAAGRAVLAAGVIARKAGIYGMVGGQTLDIALTGKDMNEEQLDFIFRLKTGALLEAAFMAGGILAGAKEDDVRRLEKIGTLVGTAFQIQDDILDVTSSQEVLGKPVLSDEKNNKTTYVTLYGMDKARHDVAAYSEEAAELLKETGDNDFLVGLVEYLINRVK